MTLKIRACCSHRQLGDFNMQLRSGMIQMLYERDHQYYNFFVTAQRRHRLITTLLVLQTATCIIVYKNTEGERT